MKFLIIVLCLLSERFLTHSIMYKRFSWFPDYAHKLLKNITKGEGPLNPWAGLIAVVMPIVLVVGVLYGVFHSVLFGLFGLVLSLFLFAYCLGPLNVFYPPSEQDTDQNITDHIATYLASANTQLFTVIFWYMLIGPVTVVLYRVIALSRGIQPISKEAKLLTDIIEWLPARLTALLYLLVGNFQNGFGAYVHMIKGKPELNQALLSECGLKALGITEGAEPSMIKAELLVEYATIALLAVIALCTLTSWV